MSDELLRVLNAEKESINSENQIGKIFSSILELVEKLKSIVKEIDNFSPQYDVDESSPGNGYRSFVYVAEKAFERTLGVCQKTSQSFVTQFFAHYYERCDNL